MKHPPLEFLTIPRIAWPSIALLVFSLALWAGSALLALGGLVPMAAAMALSTAAAFIAFTPLHDATHRSVSRLRWVSSAAGRLASIPLFAPFEAFRYVHLEHHRHTNDPVKDPDYWSTRASPSTAMPGCGSPARTNSSRRARARRRSSVTTPGASSLRGRRAGPAERGMGRSQNRPGGCTSSRRCPQ